MTLPLDPAATNVVRCSSCSWVRFIDHLRSYRGGHTDPDSGAECHEMLVFEQASTLPPEVFLLGHEEAFGIERSAEQLAELAVLYELEGSDVEDAIDSASNT